MKSKGTMLESFNAAIKGIVWVLKSQKNMKFHFLAAAGILIVSIFLEFSKLELIAIFFSIVFVLTAEMFNTVIEYTIDIISPEFSKRARIIKDVSAGAVLISAINAAVIGYVVFFVRFIPEFPPVISRVKQVPPYLTFIAISLLVVFVIGAKAGNSRKGQGPLSMIRGGMPSLHAAVSFACWTVIMLVYKDLLLTVLTLLFSVLVSQSRVQKGVHTAREVVAGSVLGVLIPVFIFQLLS